MTKLPSILLNELCGLISEISIECLAEIEMPEEMKDSGFDCLSYLVCSLADIGTYPNQSNPPVFYECSEVL